MKVKKENNCLGDFVWACENVFGSKVWGKETTLGFGLRVSCSKLKLEEICLLSYETIIGTKRKEIESQYFVSMLHIWR